MAATVTPAPASAEPTRFKEGDAVMIVARDASAADTKSGLYYTHFANMRGRILKAYGEEASILVDRDSLPGNVRLRHEESETAERTKYLDRMSEDAKSRMSQREKEFSLNYAVLVSMKDLRPDTGTPATPPAPPTEAGRVEAKAIAQAMKVVDPVTGDSTVGEASQDASDGGESGTDSAAKRLTAGELDVAEATHLAEIAQKKRSKGKTA